MRPLHAAAILPALLSSLLACDGTREDSSPDRVGVRDSAGVRIVVTPVDSVEDLPTWEVVSETTLVVPEEVGVYQLYRVPDVAVMEDGRILVANGDATVLEFDSEGRFVRSYGRKGEGPGEFIRPVRVEATEDGGFVVYDQFLSGGVLSRFSPNGEYVDRVSAIPGVSGNVLILGYSETIGVLMRVEDQRFLNPPSQDTTVIGWVGLPEGEWSELGRYPSKISFHTVENGVREPGEAPFSPVPSGAVLGDRAVVTDGRHYEALLQDSSGNIEGRYRLTLEPVPVDDQLREEFTETLVHYLDSISPGAGRAYRRSASRTPWAPTVPAYDWVVTGSDGRIWLREANPYFWRLSWQPAVSETWHIVAPEGDFVGWVVLPRGFRLMEVRGEELYGIGVDEVGLESVRRVTVRLPG